MIAQIDSINLNQAHTNGAALVMLDVRESWEFECANITGSINIPMSVLTQRLEAIRALRSPESATAPESALVLICHHGSRSMQCAQFLAAQGFSGLVNLRGGIDAWSQQVDSAVPRY